MKPEPAYTPLDAPVPVILELDHGTRIRLDGLGETYERSGRPRVPLDFVYIKRGHMSKRAVRQRLTRWFNNLLAEAIAKLQDPSVPQHRAQVRNARWDARHIHFRV